MQTKRRVIFFSLVVVLMLQGLMIYEFGEPYPAVWAPGFKGGVETRYTAPQISFHFSDHSTFVTSQKDLLSQFPNSHHNTFMSFFRPPPSQRPQGRRKLTRLLPGYRKGYVNRMNRLPDAWHWFKRQAQRLFRRHDLRAVNINWRVYSIPDHRFLGTNGVYRIDHEDAR